MPSPCHCLDLRRAARATTALYDRHLRAVGISIAQYALLRGIERLGPVGITEAAEALSLDRTTLGRNLRPLERAGLLERIMSPGDHRRREIALTPAGRRALARALPRWHAAQAEFASWLGGPQTETLRALLAIVETFDAGSRPRSQRRPSHSETHRS